MKKARSHFACLLALGLAVSALVPSTHALEETSNPRSSDVRPLLQESFDSALQSVNGASSENTEESKAFYTYTFSENIENPETADVSLDLTLSFSSNNYSAILTGTVYSNELPNGVVLWEGPLFGTITIGEDYTVIASFSKLESSPDIQVTATLTPFNSANREDTISPLIFSFGENVITPSVRSALLDMVNRDTSELPPTDGIAPSAVSDSFNRVGNDAYGNFTGGDVSGRGQRARAYFNNGRNALAVCINSYVSDVQDAFDREFDYALSSVSSFEIQITRNSTSDLSTYCWIDSMEHFDFDVDDFNNGNVYIESLFRDAMSLLGVPTSTITSVLGGLMGEVDDISRTGDTTSSNYVGVSVTFPVTQHANFDGSSPGPAIVCQLDRNNNGTYVGNSSFNMSTSLRYRTMVVDYSSDTTNFVYTSTNDTDRDFTVTLS